MKFALFALFALGCGIFIGDVSGANGKSIITKVMVEEHLESLLKTNTARAVTHTAVLTPQTHHRYVFASRFLIATQQKDAPQTCDIEPLNSKYSYFLAQWPIVSWRATWASVGLRCRVSTTIRRSATVSDSCTAAATAMRTTLRRSRIAERRA